MQAALIKVFGDDLQFDVEVDPQGPSNQAVVITLAVLMMLSMLGLIIVSVFIIR